MKNISIMIVFFMLDSFITEAECVQAIVNYAVSYESGNQLRYIHQFWLRLFYRWQKLFGWVRSLISIRRIKNKLDRYLKGYSEKVQNGKGWKRTNMVDWKAEHNLLFKLLASTENTDNYEENEKFITTCLFLYFIQTVSVQLNTCNRTHLLQLHLFYLSLIA